MNKSIYKNSVFMLKIWLEHFIPEEKKPRKIEVKEATKKAKE